MESNETGSSRKWKNWEDNIIAFSEEHIATRCHSTSKQISPIKPSMAYFDFSREYQELSAQLELIVTLFKSPVISNCQSVLF